MPRMSDLDGEWQLSEFDGEYELVAEDSGRALAVGESWHNAQAIANELNELSDALTAEREALNRLVEAGRDLLSLVREYIIDCQGNHQVAACDECNLFGTCYKLTVQREYATVLADLKGGYCSASCVPDETCGDCDGGSRE